MRRAIPFLAFATTIPAANWLIGHVGTVCIPQGPCLIPVGFGQMAPSGVLMIGLTLVLRDWLHEDAGFRWALAAIFAGAALSLLVSPPALALASATAFMASELGDLAIYAPLRERHKPMAVLVSGIAGAVIDSALFLILAFGSLDFLAGQVLGKLYASAAVAMILMARRWRRVA